MQASDPKLSVVRSPYFDNKKIKNLFYFLKMQNSKKTQENPIEISLKFKGSDGIRPLMCIGMFDPIIVWHPPDLTISIEQCLNSFEYKQFLYKTLEEWNINADDIHINEPSINPPCRRSESIGNFHTIALHHRSIPVVMYQIRNTAISRPNLIKKQHEQKETIENLSFELNKFKIAESEKQIKSLTFEERLDKLENENKSLKTESKSLKNEITNNNKSFKNEITNINKSFKNTIANLEKKITNITNENLEYKIKNDKKLLILSNQVQNLKSNIF